MDDPRELLRNRVRQNKDGFIVDYNTRWNKHILSSIIDAMFYTLADYIRCERENNEKGMGILEINYYCTDEFINTENPIEYLETHRDVDDVKLMIYIYDNMLHMEPGPHRRTLLYLTNILYFDL
jgi:hypothetical protein